MTLATKRTDLATALTTALAGLGYRVYPFRPIPLAAGSGWLQVTLADTEDVTYTETRVTYDVVLCLGPDVQVAETEFDRIAAQMLAALVLQGRGVAVRPLSLALDGTELFCAAGTLITEVGS